MGRQQRHDRTETIEKAMILFWRSGFSGTSLRDLETGLDMRPGSIYANFGNKEHFYGEAMNLYAANSFRDFQGHLENSGTFMAGLGNFMTQIIFTEDTPCSCMLAKTLADINPDNAALREKAGHLIAQFEDVMASALKDARNSGDLGAKCHVRSLARFIVVQIMGIRSYAEMHKTPIVLEELRRDVLRAIAAKAS